MINLVTRAADLSMNAAATYCHENKIDTTEVDVLLAHLQTEVKVVIEDAIADAKAAIDANMVEMASATFAASMRLAGINAAKKFSPAPPI